MSAGVGDVTKVYLRNDPALVSRLRKVVCCIAESVGMDEDETDEAKLLLTEACVNAIKHGSPQGDARGVLVTLSTNGCEMTADVSDSGHRETWAGEATEHGGFGLRIIRLLSNGSEFVRDESGLTVRLTKRARHTPA